MSDDLTFLFIHGHHGDDDAPKFVSMLDHALTNLGYPPLALGRPHTPGQTDRLLAPTYTAVLESQHQPQDPLPRTPRPELSRRIAAEATYERNVAAAEERLAVFDEEHRRGILSVIPRPLTKPVTQSGSRYTHPGVHRYTTNQDARRAVLRHLLRQIGDHRELVIVAHSLGSVVLTGLINRLPKDTHVPLLLTIGSPLRLSALKDVQDLRSNFPHTRVDLWLNFYDRRDPATFGRGIEREYPPAMDVQADTGGIHSTAAYLGRRAVANEIGRVFFGDLPTPSTSQAIARSKLVRYANVEAFRGPLLRFVWLGELVSLDPNLTRRAKIASTRDHLVREFQALPMEPALGLRPPVDKERLSQLPGKFGRSELLLQMLLLLADDPVPSFDFNGIRHATQVDALAQLAAKVAGAEFLSHVELEKLSTDERTSASVIADTVAQSWAGKSWANEAKPAVKDLRKWDDDRPLAIRLPGDSTVALLSADLFELEELDDQESALVTVAYPQYVPGGSVGSLLTIGLLAHRAVRSSGDLHSERFQQAWRNFAELGLHLSRDDLRGVLRILVAHAVAEKRLSVSDYGEFALSLVTQMHSLAQESRRRIEDLSYKPKRMKDWRRNRRLEDEAADKPGGRAPKTDYLDEAAGREKDLARAVMFLRGLLR